MDTLWFFAGKRALRHMEAGQFASAAHIVRQGIKQGVFDSAMSWRTAILLFQPLDLNRKPKLRSRNRFGGEL